MGSRSQVLFQEPSWPRRAESRAGCSRSAGLVLSHWWRRRSWLCCRGGLGGGNKLLHLVFLLFQLSQILRSQPLVVSKFPLGQILLSSMNVVLAEPVVGVG